MQINLKSVPHADKLLSFFNDRGHNEYVNPLRDWTIGLFVAVLVFFTGVFIIGYDFYSQFGESGNVTLSEEQPVVYRDKEVRAFSELYKTKEKNFNALRNDRVYVPPVVPETEVLIPEENADESLADTPTTE